MYSSKMLTKNKKNVVKDTTSKPSSNISGNLEVNTITGKISIKHADGSETLTEIPIKDVVISRPMVNIGMNANYTKNLGNYSSAKVGVSLYVPCEATELEDTYVFIKNWVNGKMAEISNEITG